MSKGNGEDKEKQYYQNILITFADGTEVQASVPAFCTSEGRLEELSVTAIKITEPKEMPEGMSFEFVK